ncbi:MAG: TolC family protein [Pseudomonadota bacterium]
MSVDQAVAYALNANHQMLNLIDKTALSELDYESARSVYKTRFGSSLSSDARLGAEVGSTYSLFMDKANESGSRYNVGLYHSSFGSNTLSEWRFSYTLPFFDNPLDNRKLAIYQAEINSARSQRMVEIGREELANEVVSAYLKLAMAIRSEQLADDERQIADSFFQAQEIRHRNGEASALELSEAKLRTIDARQSQDIAALDRGSQEDAFRLLLGMDYEELLSIDTRVLREVESPLVEWPLQNLEDMAINHRIELLAKREELTMTNHRIESTKIGNLPPMEVSLQYSLIGEGESIDDSFNVDDQRFGVGLRMNTDLQNSETKIKQRKLYLHRRAQQREFDYLQRSIISQVRKSYSAAQRARSALDFIREYQALAEQKHEQQQILWRRGDVTELEYFESQHELNRARHRALSAKVDYLLAEQDLAMATGHGITDAAR